MRILALTIVAVGLVWSVGETRAQTYDPAFPFCMYLVTWGAGATTIAVTIRWANARRRLPDGLHGATPIPITPVG